MDHAQSETSLTEFTKNMVLEWKEQMDELRSTLFIILVETENLNNDIQAVHHMRLKRFNIYLVTHFQ